MDGVLVRVEGGWQHHCVKFWLDLHRCCAVSMQSVKINIHPCISASLCVMHLAKSARHSGETNCSGDNGSAVAAVGGECIDDDQIMIV